MQRFCHGCCFFHAFLHGKEKFSDSGEESLSLKLLPTLPEPAVRKYTGTISRCSHAAALFICALQRSLHVFVVMDDGRRYTLFITLIATLYVFT